LRLVYVTQRIAKAPTIKPMFFKDYLNLFHQGIEAGSPWLNDRNHLEGGYVSIFVGQTDQKSASRIVIAMAIKSTGAGYA
ncbi:hypothetical protein, partial [Pseudomonas syringae group genomosp. 7]